MPLSPLATFSVVLVCLSRAFGCAPQATPDIDAPSVAAPFGPPVAQGVLEHDPIREASGLVASRTKRDLYIVTKRSTDVTVYRASYPHSTTATIEMEAVTILRLHPVPGAGAGGQGAVAGDIAPSGLEVLIKTYAQVYYWSRPSPDAPLFSGAPLTLPYLPEPQGEAIGWAADGNGYYTVSEEVRSVPATLYYYPRLAAPYREP